MAVAERPTQTATSRLPDSVRSGAWPWYHGWNVVAASMLTQAATLGIIQYSFSLWVEPIIAELHASRAGVLTSVAILATAMAVLAPLAGRTLDRMPIRVMVAAGLGVLAVHLLLMSHIGAVWHMWVLEGSLAPLAISMAGTMSGQVVVVRWFERRRGLALGIFALGTSIGGLVCPPILAILLARFGWRESYTIAAVVVALMIPIVWLTIRLPTPSEFAYEAVEKVETTPSSPNRNWTAKDILADKTYWIIAFACVPPNLAFACILYNLGTISKDIGAAPSALPVALSAMAGAMIFGKLVFGLLLDRIAVRITYWLVVTMLFGGVTLLSFAVGSMQLVLAIAIMGGAVGGFLPLLGAFAATYFGRSVTGLAIGLISPLLYLATATPALAALIRDYAGSYRPAFHIIMALLVCGALGMTFLRPVGRD